MDSTQQKQILYISYDGMTDPLGQSQVIPYLVGLSKKGLNFTIVSCEKKEKYLENKEIITRILNNASIAWHPLFYTKQPPVLSTLYDYYRLKRKVRALYKQVGFDMIHCRSYLPSLLGLWIKKKYQVPFIFDMRGFWADERVDGGIWNIKNPIFKIIYRYFKKKKIAFVNESAEIVCLTNAGKNEILKWENLKINDHKISVIPCCVDIDVFNPDNFSPVRQQEVRQRLQIKNSDFVLGYLGSLGTWYLVDEMMRFFSTMKKKIETAKFLFVTPDDPADIIVKMQKYGIDATNVIITKAARNEVPLMISLFDFGIFFIKPAYSKMASSPTKQGEIMAMGIPVICNSGIGDTDEIITAYNAGLIVRNSKFDEPIQNIGSGINYDKKEIRDGAIEYFSLDNGIEKYYKLYRNVLS